MSEPYLVYLETNKDGSVRSSSGHSKPTRILYVLSEDDVADAYDQARDPDLECGDGEHTAYYLLPNDLRDMLFYDARKAIEWTGFASGEWNKTLMASVKDTLATPPFGEPRRK